MLTKGNLHKAEDMIRLTVQATEIPSILFPSISNISSRIWIPNYTMWAKCGPQN